MDRKESGIGVGESVNFSSNLKYLRERAAEQQKDLASLLNVSVATMSKYENGVAEPDLKKAIAISKHYGVTLDDLVLNDLRPVMPLYIANFRYLRQKHKMTQEDMANLLGYRGKQGYSMIETGKSGISIENLEKLADFFGVTLDQMVKQDLSKEGV